MFNSKVAQPETAAPGRADKSDGAGDGAGAGAGAGANAAEAQPSTTVRNPLTNDPQPQAQSQVFMRVHNGTARESVGAGGGGADIVQFEDNPGVATMVTRQARVTTAVSLERWQKQSGTDLISERLEVEGKGTGKVLRVSTLTSHD